MCWAPSLVCCRAALISNVLYTEDRVSPILADTFSRTRPEDGLSHGEPATGVLMLTAWWLLIDDKMLRGDLQFLNSQSGLPFKALMTFWTSLTSKSNRLILYVAYCKFVCLGYISTALSLCLWQANVSVATCLHGQLACWYFAGLMYPSLACKLVIGSADIWT